MANRTFENAGFWERVDKAVLASGMSKREIAEKMGVERKALYSRKSANGDKRSWHSGRVASFCKITGVSADWLLGISNVGMLKPKKVKPLSFTVLDAKTGKEPVLDGNHVFREKWFKESPVVYWDLEGWFISAEGELVLIDAWGNVGYPPKDRFNLVMV